MYPVAFSICSSTVTQLDFDALHASTTHLAPYLGFTSNHSSAPHSNPNPGFKPRNNTAQTIPPIPYFSATYSTPPHLALRNLYSTQFGLNCRRGSTYPVYFGRSHRSGLHPCSQLLYARSTSAVLHERTEVSSRVIRPLLILIEPKMTTTFLRHTI